MTDTPISDAAVFHSYDCVSHAVPYHVAQELERKVTELKAAAQINTVNRGRDMDNLRARNEELELLLTNERIMRYAAEAERNCETERCAKVAREFTLSPVVGKAIAALIMEGR